MNDSELDQLLSVWQAPAPPRSLRDGVRARFPRAERRSFARPLRWTLAIAALSIALAGMAQTSDSSGEFPLVRIVRQLYESFLAGREARRPAAIVAQVRRSDPKVYVDGLLAAPLGYGPAATMKVQVPGEGVYSVTAYRFTKTQDADGRPTGWVEAGRIHGNVIEFQAGGKQVRIECNQPVVDQDRPVFVGRRP
jgi:hypothetical protein